jgi:succinate dehydrogenase flavin-adding protein (antitoxin of CptAB toxin-antitoxin module)
MSNEVGAAGRRPDKDRTMQAIDDLVAPLLTRTEQHCEDEQVSEREQAITKLDIDICRTLGNTFAARCEYLYEASGACARVEYSGHVFHLSRVRCNDIDLYAWCVQHQEETGWSIVHWPHGGPLSIAQRETILRNVLLTINQLYEAVANC